MTMDRRDFLNLLAMSAGALAAPGEAAAALRLGPEQPFSREVLRDMAARLAAQPYRAPPQPAPEIVGRLDYDAWGKIRFNPDKALFAEGPGRFPVTFFHLGMFFRKSVAMHVVENAVAREILYDPALFEMPADSPARALPASAGFAGFQIREPRDGALDWRKNDWVAFLGAAYFRAIGALRQYGLSARAVALDVAEAGRAEEFPDFTQIWFETPREGADSITLHALLEGPSIVGASTFVMQRGDGVVMDVEHRFHLRAPVGRFGLAPLTSMYWYSETKKPTAVDWRPEVHDSDGLALWTGAGERIWRPLNNPGRIVVSAFGDDNPRGFGLLQRDRAFDHYQDGVYYERRPSLWIEPKGAWGKGAVQLVEIPTDDEIHDNIVAMWVPAQPTKAGDVIDVACRMHWLADEPYPTSLGRCVATRLGNGGQPGQPRPKGVRKFMVEFLGGPLAAIPFGVKPEPVLWASRGAFSYVFSEAVPNDAPGHWRAQFDLTVAGEEPVEMRCYLRAGDQVLTETWAYQYHPF
jgi:glucans biosynthesis protein